MSRSDAERKPISLRKVLGSASFVDCGDVLIRGISCDSRRVTRGDVFVALPGSVIDGHDCIRSAIAAGAVAVLVERPQAGIRVPQCVVPDARAAWATLCMFLHHVVPSDLTVAAVTGTNGKTTTAWLLRSILECAGRRTGLLGTIEYSDGRDTETPTLTTPDSWDLARLFARMTQRGTKHCVMEISSHALDQRRCSAIPLATAAVTNITQDHFDYHENAEQYRIAKARIADLLLPGKPLLIGTDDIGSRQLHTTLAPQRDVLSFGFAPESNLQVAIVGSEPAAECSSARTVLQLKLCGGSIEVRTMLVGRHNALNCLAAAGLAEQLEIALEFIVAGLERVTCVPGRMERISCGQPFQVFVDYAHSPDALRHCLQTARSVTAGRVICVFGAGGDRDSAKRPLMAQAAEAADLVIVTSDNPRSEKPQKIIDDILPGFTHAEQILQCVDRASAIGLGLNSAAAGDTVVIAGRGHETMQHIGDRQISFDDRRVARHLLQTMVLAETQASHENSPTRSRDISGLPAAVSPEQIPV